MVVMIEPAPSEIPMGLKDILLVLNDRAQAASGYALSLAKITGAEVTAVSPVFEPDLSYVAAELPADMLGRVHADAEREAGVALSRFEHLARENGVTVRPQLAEAPPGDVAREIQRIARFYDLAVVDQEDPDKARAIE